MAAWPYSTRRWQRLRLQKLRAKPICEYCTRPNARPATEVDHRQAIKAGGDPWAWNNLVSACHTCHSRKTIHVDILGKDRVPVKGCDADGLPLDPEHSWNEKISQG
jgi:5-methylcytosine-specific restriction endonuclease McrA